MCEQVPRQVKELSTRLGLPNPTVVSATPSTHPDTWTNNASTPHSFSDVKSRYKELDRLLLSGSEERGLNFISMVEVFTTDGGLDPKYSLDGVHLNAKARKVYLDILNETFAARCSGSL